MDKNRIKKFAIWARTELIMRVTQRAYYYGVDGESQANPDAGEVNGRLLTEDERRRRRKLVLKVQEKGFQNVMEEAAYTWFNRFAALRYMEVNGVLPTRVRVFSSREGAFAPQILDECLTMENLDGLDKSVLFDLKEKDATEDLYKYLLITQCNALGSILPVMFQQIEDYTQLLLPDNLLREGSVIHKMVTEIEEDDWRDQVQIIGWLYQYYNSEPKDAVFAALKKNIKVSKENIPAATQLFTPDWIVRYMVENSLGRLWTEHKCAADDTKSEKELAEGYEWKYYLPEAEQEPEVAAKLKELRESRKDLNPTEIKVIDPCMGSGHILVYAFDLLVQIYKDAGYREKDIPELILKNNLYGLDIDDRAYQLAYFAVMMRAWHYNHRILVKRIEPNLCAIQESNGLGKWSELNMDMSGAQQLNLESQFVQLADELIEKFQDAKEYGSILDVAEKDYGALLTYIKELQENSVLDLSMAAWLHEVCERLPGLVKQAQIMGQKYDVVVTNPPYMGSGNMGMRLSEYVKMHYPDYRFDLFSVCMVKFTEMTKDDGYAGFLSPYVWMFISSYEKMRKLFIEEKTIETLIQFEYSAFEEATVPICTFVLHNIYANKKGTYLRLVDYRGGMEVQRKKALEAICSHEEHMYFESNAGNFKKVPGSPIAYWVSENFTNDFDNPNLQNVCHVTRGLTTGNNELYLRNWHEVSFENMSIDSNNIEEAKNSKKKWFPHNKGGEFRNWYGNNDLVVLFENNGEALREYYKINKAVRFTGIEHYFEKGITWTALSSGTNSFRYSQCHTFDSNKGPMLFAEEEKMYYILGLLNSKVNHYFISVINPTLSLQNADMNKLPFILKENAKENVIEKVKSNINITKIDWDSFETSWDFKKHPLLNGSNILSEAYDNYQQTTNARFDTLKANEEELNRIFIDIYGLSDELTPNVADKDVTVARIYDTKEEIPDSMKGNNYVLTREDVVKSLISYAVGCMFGRYSLDEPGLICAGGEFDPSKYETYHPDEDAIIPICDDEYFEDDIVDRFCAWLSAAFGKENFMDNLLFIADSLSGGKGLPREVIRNYFLNDFYSDHCKRYQKRPIYWLFDAGKKNSFKALVYLHRYDRDTLARMRTNYVYKQQELYKTRIETTQNRIDTAASQTDKNKCKRELKKLHEQFDEIHVYEEKIHHYADLRQEIDLDDGVKHNYALFADILAKIK
ncbi:BREX-1 system adenine-specific DNA-methyltransferase PglX [Selenomonas caprae]|uniref:site-specific DNA-methyltransferase (adenine-specific) n=1 Tax=Selenomonas caprae TaxID=2606905 RepID=A0A5D6WL23_9FIRM|nr:BREX-1 system adenine-specific DNA-methyltransferase PglX [Selenomonas caprae]TYZ28540.1 BREX-1 system adenine-specific DNA-methyltransferase PglX [Selenomonas caprae]